MKRLTLIFLLLAIFYYCEKNSPPSCEIVSPELGAEIIQGETVTFSVNATDLDGSIKKVRLYVDDTLIATVEELPYDFSWETDEAKIGSHVIRAVAIDNENGEGETSIEIQIVEITFDDVKPVVEILTPTEGSLVDEAINIVAKGIDNVGVEYVDFMIKEEDWIIFEKDSTPAFFEYSATLNTLNYSDGLIKLSIAAFDAAGNCGKDSIGFYINNSADTIAPVVEIFTPLNNDTISQHIVVRAIVTDNIGIEHVNFHILDGTYRLLGTDYYAIRDNEYAILWDTRDTPDGTYGIEAVAFDAVANKGSDRIGLTVDNSGSRPDNDSFIYEGRKYYFKTIGTQTWMVENLAYLPSITYSGTDPANAPRYDVYRYSGTSTETAKHTTNYSEFGVLYNFNAALTACPPGWHLPSDKEWKTLEMFLGMSQSDANAVSWRDSGDVGFKLKSSSGWSDYGDGDNSSGFEALPGGFRNTDGDYVYLGFRTDFWTSSSSSAGSFSRSLKNDKMGVFRSIHSSKYRASVRCIKDN